MLYVLYVIYIKELKLKLKIPKYRPCLEIWQNLNANVTRDILINIPTFTVATKNNKNSDKDAFESNEFCQEIF